MDGAAKELIQIDALKHLMVCFDQNNLELLEQVIFALGNIAAECVETRNALLDIGALEMMANALLNCQSNSKQERDFAWAVSNCCRGSPSPDYHQMRCVLPALVKVMMTSDNSDVCWALNKMSDNAKEDITDFTDKPLIFRLI